MNVVDGSLILSDPLGFAPHPIALSRLAAIAVGLMNGENTVWDIATELTRITGNIVGPAEVLALVEELDRMYLLESERFRREYEKRSREFLGKGVRPYTLAGVSYPDNPTALKRMVSPAKRDLLSDGSPGKAKGVVIPHIDPRRGWKVYLNGLNLIFKNPAQLYVIFGVAHSPISHPVQVLPLDLDTPLGTLKVDRKTVDNLISSVGFDLLSDPLAFVNEHSVEFPAVFIKSLFPEEEVSVIPLIVSDIGGNSDAIDEVVSRLKECVGGKDFLPVAAVDLSHSGPRFGDERFDGERVRYHDGEFMAAFSTAAPESLLYLYEEFGNPTNIDAFGATYALMGLSEAQRGEVLGYEISYEEETASAVSFMAGGLF